MRASKVRIDRLLSTYWRRLEALYGRVFIFTNHTLRRTGGRLMWFAGVPIETIRDIMGHVDTSETLRYLGINLEDKREAMKKVAQYKRSLSFPEKVRIEVRPVSLAQ